MKRSSCLSAMLVGLSVMTASVAFAAPPAGGNTAAKAKGQPNLKTVQPSDPTPAGGGADPTAAPTTPAPTEEPAAAPVEATPAVTLGTAGAPPGADTPAAAAEEPKPKPKRRPWAGTQIFAATTMTTATLNRGQQQDYNPTIDSYAAISPRFAINDAFQIRGRIVFSYEYTNSDTTVTNNEPRFGDALLQLFYRKIPEIPGGIKPAVAINATLPTSPESRARTLVFSPGATLQLSRSFEGILPGKGSLDLLASTTYAHPLYRSTTPERRGEGTYQLHCVGGATSCGNTLTGTMNPSDTLSYVALISTTWGKFSPALFYLGGTQWAYKPTDAQYNGRSLESPDGFKPTNVRQTSYFAAWLDYEANTWLTAEVGYTLTRAALNEDGSRGNPFFDKYQDQRVYLGANINIDNIMKTLEGGPAEAGVVRAQNKRPIGQF
jgi:hypothetical protein